MNPVCRSLKAIKKCNEELCLWRVKKGKGYFLRFSKQVNGKLFYFLSKRIEWKSKRWLKKLNWSLLIFCWYCRALFFFLLLFNLFHHVALAIAVHHGFIFVYAKSFGDVIFIQLIPCNDNQAAEWLQYDCWCDKYGDYKFQLCFYLWLKGSDYFFWFMQRMFKVCTDG